MTQIRTRGRGRSAQRYPLQAGQKRPRHRASSTLVYPSAGIIHEGALTRHGYELDKGENLRHFAIEESAKEDGYAETQRRLTAIKVVNKHRPHTHHIIDEDQEWLREHAYVRDPSKDTAGGEAFVNKAGTRVSHDGIPKGGFRVWKS